MINIEVVTIEISNLVMIHLCSLKNNKNNAMNCYKKLLNINITVIILEFEKWNVGVKHLHDDFITSNGNAMKRMPVLNKGMAQLPYFRKVGKMVHLKFEEN